MNFEGFSGFDDLGGFDDFGLFGKSKSRKK
jgi:hypothetical protein